MSSTPLRKLYFSTNITAANVTDYLLTVIESTPRLVDYFASEFKTCNVSITNTSGVVFSNIDNWDNKVAFYRGLNQSVHEANEACIKLLVSNKLDALNKIFALAFGISFPLGIIAGVILFICGIHLAMKVCDRHHRQPALPPEVNPPVVNPPVEVNLNQLEAGDKNQQAGSSYKP